jgi:hypothetical protein
VRKASERRTFIQGEPHHGPQEGRGKKIQSGRFHPPQVKRSNPVDSIRHKDKRKNIPTEELRDFVALEENAPKTMLCPRAVWPGDRGAKRPS